MQCYINKEASYVVWSPNVLFIHVMGMIKELVILVGAFLEISLSMNGVDSRPLDTELIDHLFSIIH